MLKVANLILVINCLFIFFFYHSVFGQYCSIVIKNDVCDISIENDEDTSTKELEVKVFTTGNKDSDGYKRLIYSAKHFEIEVNNIDNDEVKSNNACLPQQQNGNSVKLLRQAIEPYKSKQNTIVIFIEDSSNTIIINGLKKIVENFLEAKAKILFATESSCQTRSSIKRLYEDDDNEAYLCSTMFMGYAQQVYKMLQNPLNDEVDTQKYYTEIYVNSSLRIDLGIKLDKISRVFQNINGDIESIEFNLNNVTLEGTLKNSVFETQPSIIYGSGPYTVNLNSWANYLGGTFKNGRCLICEDNLILYEIEHLPVVSMSIFVERPTAFFEEFLEGVKTINYPKQNIHLFVYNNEKYHDNEIRRFIKEHKDTYKTVDFVNFCKNLDDLEARKLSIEKALQKKSDFLFSIDSDVRIDDSDILLELLKYNKSFIAPVLTLANYNFSNFWGALSKTGYYARSHDFLDIIHGEKKGIWNVPYVSMCYLTHKSVLHKINFDDFILTYDMAMCDSLRREGVFMNVINVKKYGHLVDSDDFDSNLTSPDFYMLLSNPPDWEKRYIHPEYHAQLKPNFTHKQPCPDVYWFPIANDRFCKDLLNAAEAFGKWSDGSNYDPRIEGGYEAVPTRDIHMNQLGLQNVWLRFLRDYVRPLKEIVYMDSDQSDPLSAYNFVVRYRPDEQDSLKPHFDSSTYTINIALNRAGIDFQGGGCRFVRYNCSVTETKKGWMLMHPGRLTHLHEGLKVTNGTRYIMISFVDP